MTFLSKSPRWWLSRGLIAALVAIGAYGLWDALEWWVGVAVVAFAALAAWPRFVVISLRLAGAIVAATLALLGFDVVAGKLGLRPSIPVGLVAAVAVFGLAAYGYLHGAGWGRWVTRLAAAGLAVVVIVAAPLLYGLLQGSGDKDVPNPERVASKLDLLIVTDGRPHPPPDHVPPEPSLSGFDLSYSVGFASGDRVRWTLANGTSSGEALRDASQGDRLPDLGVDAPVLRQGADSVLLLLVDGTAPVSDAPEDLPDAPARPGEVAHWQDVASNAGVPLTPAFALLQTTRPSRLRRWRQFATPGGAVSAQALGSLTATDAAVRLAVASPTSQADFALALEHRPVLLFDEEESVPRPLSIAALFEEERVRLCTDRGVTKTDCSDPILYARELENGGTHLRLRLPSSRELRETALREKALAAAKAMPAVSEAAPGASPAATPPPGTGLPGLSANPVGARSAIYVHPVSTERDGRLLLYLDYWWYLPDNPSGVGGGAFCGAGLVIAGVTCQNHQSDWEGLTVIVDRTGPRPFVTAVQYAQHDSVVRYGWNLLRQRWDNPKLSPFVEAPGRPLAFVAKGTHATYPIPCGRCHQVAKPSIGEGPHRGGLPWIGNETGACGEDACLQALPTREAGRQPALWNAFTGAWGDVHCFLSYYCDSGLPPNAPGQQERYRHPTRYDGIVDRGWTFHRQAFGE